MLKKILVRASKAKFFLKNNEWHVHVHHQQILVCTAFGLSNTKRTSRREPIIVPKENIHPIIWIIRSIYWRSYSNKIQELVWGYIRIIFLVTSRTKEDKSTTSTKEPEELKSKEPVQNSTPTSSEAWIAKNPEIFFF